MEIEERIEEQFDSFIQYEFPILHKGWEMDNKGWVLMNGKVVTTNHGALCEMPIDEIRRKCAEARFSLAGLEFALVVAGG